MDHTTPHRITVCTSCKHEVDGRIHQPGVGLIEDLTAALCAADQSLAVRFEVAGVACMAGCKRPCALAYHAAGKATYLFGDIAPDDMPDLVDFARQYASLPDGWCSSVERPGKLRTSTLARVPAPPAASAVKAAQ